MGSEEKGARLAIGQLGENDVGEAMRLTRLAFGTFLGLPDPMQMFGDREIIRNRWRDKSSSLLVALMCTQLMTGVDYFRGDRCPVTM